MSIASLERNIKLSLSPEDTIGFEGNHGIGKTSFVKKNMRRCIAEQNNVPIDRVHVITRCASQIDPADMIGEVRSFKGRTFNCPPSWIPTDKKYDDEMIETFGEDGYKVLTKYDDFYILFIDEWKRGNQLIHNALMEVTLEHTIFGVPLHEKCYVAVADNENTDIYNGNANIDPAQMDRVENYPYDPTDDEILDIFKEKVDAGYMHPVVLEYLMTYKEHIIIPSETIRDCAQKGQKTASPRAWEKLGKKLMRAARHGFDYVEESEKDPQINAELSSIANAILGVHGAPFVTYCNDRKGMSIDLELVIYNKGTATDIAAADRELKKLAEIKKLSVPVIAYNASRLVSKKGLKKVEYGKNLLALLQNLPNEGIAAFYSDWKHTNEKDAIDWMSYSGARMNVIYKTLGGYKKWREAAIARGVNIDSDEPIGG